MIRFLPWIAFLAALSAHGQPFAGGLESRVRIGSGPWLGVSTVGPEGELPFAYPNSLAALGRGSFYRVFFDRNQKLVFAYRLDVTEGDSEDGYRIHIKPVNDKFREMYENTPWLRSLGKKQRLPTFARAFGARTMRVGEQISVRILHERSSGRTISDILTLSRAEQSTEGEPRELRLSGLQVSDEGAVVGRLPGSAVGRFVMFHLPGYGAFFFSRDSPAGYPQFRPSAVTDGRIIRFSWKGRRFECVSDVPITNEKGTVVLWFHVEPRYQPPNSSGKAEGAYLSAAGTLQWMLN